MKKKDVIADKASKFWIEYTKMGKELEKDLIEYVKEFGNNNEINLAANGIIPYTTLKRWDDTEVDYIEKLKIVQRHGADELIMVDSEGYDFHNTEYSTDNLLDVCLLLGDLTTEMLYVCRKITNEC